MTLHDDETPATLEKELSEKSDAALSKGISVVEGITPEDEENHKRGVRSDNRSTTAKIKRRFFWFLFWLFCAVTTICSLGFLYLIFVWVMSFVDNSAKLEKFIFDVIFTLSIVLATLFLERIFSNKDD